MLWFKYYFSDEADSRGSRKVVTAAHKLNNLNSRSQLFQQINLICRILYFSDLKVRLGELDTEGFRPPEKTAHIEVAVESMVIHPEVSRFYVRSFRFKDWYILKFSFPRPDCLTMLVFWSSVKPLLCQVTLIVMTLIDNQWWFCQKVLSEVK